MTKRLMAVTAISLALTGSILSADWKDDLETSVRAKHTLTKTASRSPAPSSS